MKRRQPPEPPDSPSPVRANGLGMPLAHEDMDFLRRDELRHIRLQLEVLRPELILEEQKIKSTIVLFGSARLSAPDLARTQLEALEQQAAQRPDDQALIRQTAIARRKLDLSHYWDKAREFARLASLAGQRGDSRHYVIVTGGGPGVMEAGNRGAAEQQARTVGFNILLPHEQAPNPYITPGLSFQFHYFAIRKMHFLMRARALAIFPGGYGTLDELFDALTLIQTGKMDRIPVLMFGESYWNKVLSFATLIEEGMIAEEDAQLVRFVETPQQAWSIIEEWYRDK